MSFKEEFAALCEKYNVAFDISDGRKIELYAMSYDQFGVHRVKENVTINFDFEAEYCEFVVEKMQ